MPLQLAAHDERAVAAVEAVQQGDVDELRRRLAELPGLATARILDDRGVGRTLLHVASDWPGHFPNGADSVAVLIAAGADVNAPVTHTDPAGSPETALHWAASSDDVSVVDALLDGGADIDAPGAVITGGTPMSDAVIFAKWKAACRLLERGARTTLWQAAALGLTDRVQAQVGQDPPPSTREICNACWHACRAGHLGVVEYLVSKGADLHWVGHEGKTPTDMALESNVSELITWVERHAP